MIEKSKMKDNVQNKEEKKNDKVDEDFGEDFEGTEHAQKLQGFLNNLNGDPRRVTVIGGGPGINGLGKYSSLENDGI